MCSFEQNGQRSKFITNCYNLKDVLDQAREAENNGQKIFPVENVIVKRRSLGDGKSAYYLKNNYKMEVIYEKLWNSCRRTADWY